MSVEKKSSEKFDRSNIQLMTAIQSRNPIEWKVLFYKFWMSDLLLVGILMSILKFKTFSAFDKILNALIKNLLFGHSKLWFSESYIKGFLKFKKYKILSWPNHTCELVFIWHHRDKNKIKFQKSTVNQLTTNCVVLFYVQLSKFGQLW